MATGLVNWRWSMWGLVLYLPLSGIPILALYPHTEPGVLAKDFLFVLPAYAGFLTERVARQRRIDFDAAPTVMFACLSVLVVVQAFNPELPNAITAMIGIKVWSLYIPLIIAFLLEVTRALYDPGSRLAR